jgi:hypothetical protein
MTILFQCVFEPCDYQGYFSPCSVNVGEFGFVDQGITSIFIDANAPLYAIPVQGSNSQAGNNITMVGCILKKKFFSCVF